MSFQTVVIMGNLGRDPETRFTANGDAICNFSVAVSEKYKEKESVTWFRCVAFGKVAEIAQKYLAKGSQCLVQGRLNEERYTDKAGVEKTSWTLRCDNLRLVGSKQHPEKFNADAPSGHSFDNFESDIPF